MVSTRPSSPMTTPLPVRSVPRIDAVNASSGTSARSATTAFIVAARSKRTSAAFGCRLGGNAQWFGIGHGSVGAKRDGRMNGQVSDGRADACRSRVRRRRLGARTRPPCGPGALILRDSCRIRARPEIPAMSRHRNPHPATVAAAIALAAALAASPVVVAQVPPTPPSARAYRGLFAAAHAGRRRRDRADSPPRAPIRTRATATAARRCTWRRSRGGTTRCARWPRPAPTRTRWSTIATTSSPSPRWPTTCRPSRSRWRSAARPTNVTSRYDGTALIAAAHLGHDGVVRELDRRRRAARSRQQPGLDGADRVDRAGQRRERATSRR